VAEHIEQPMSFDLRAASANYLAGRRTRGYKLVSHDGLIASFLDLLDTQAGTTITVVDALAFAQAGSGAQRWRAAKLQAIRPFAAHVHALDPAAAELIPTGLITARATRRIPYLYTQGQIVELMGRCTTLSSPLLAAGMTTLIGLLAATGLRSGEAVGLDFAHLSVDPPVLSVTGKYSRQRLVPLHESTVQALLAYEKVRATLAGKPSTGPLLVGARGNRLDATTARRIFRQVANDCNLPATPGSSPPRLHDYADPRVMPTSARNPLHDGVSVLAVSA
jgi:site-specific recombinase XerD